MEFFTEPQVELVGRPIIDIQGVLNFLEAHDMEWPEFQKKLDSNMDLGDRDAEWIPEFAGRCCYMSFTEKDKEPKGRSHEEHIKHLIEVGHFSVIEHVAFNFIVWGVSRSLTHELCRHRLASYSQLSQRFVNSSNTAFVIPPAILEFQKIKPNIFKEWQSFCEQSQVFYSKLTNELSDMYSNIENKTERRKKARQAARSVLPNATETKIFVTMNARSLRHFWTMRSSPHSDLEIRTLSNKIFDIMRKEFPLLTYGIERIKLEDETYGIKNSYTDV